MKTLVFGASGYFGQLLCQTIPDSVGSAADIADPTAVSREFDKYAPQVVINCAGKTGRPNVDWCESHQLETVKSNVTGALVVLDCCLSRGLYLAHLSSGCIYQGDNNGAGYRESDPPNFSGSFYSRTKAYSDQILSEFPVLVLRPRMPFDGSTHPRTLFGKLVNYSRVLDAENSFTYVPDFVKAAHQLIAERRTGVFNIVNPGRSTPYQMMCRYRDEVDPSHHFERMSVDELSEVTTAGRSNCVLSAEKLESAGVELQTLDAAVSEALSAIRATVTSTQG